MFKVFGDARDTSDILAIDAAEEPLTSLLRQEKLFADGYRFEAAVARASLVEGLLLMYLLSAKQMRRTPLDANTEKRLSAERITLGQVHAALRLAAAFHDQRLGDAVAAFVHGRNHLAHHAAVGNRPFDLAAFFGEGGAIARALWAHVLSETREHREANS